MYRILRNNKEQGPYSLDELVQLSLRPYDLIWLEGKSACWRYPSEIEELKPYLSGAVESNPVSQSLPKSVQPVAKQELKQVTQSIAPAEEQEEELTAAMLEQKANAIYQRVQAYNARCEQEAKDVQTKYARSLEDLKQDYADWIHGKKHKKREVSSGVKGWIAFGAVSAAFLIFLLAGKDKEIVWPIYLHKNTASENTAKVKEKEQVKEASPVNATPNQALESQKAAVESFIDSMRNELRKQNLVSKSGVESGKHSKKKTTDSQVSTHPVQSILLPEKVINPPSIKAADLDARFIPAENSSRIKEVQVTVHNTGTVPLKQVTVDVFYYKKGERLIDKETLFFNDIGPGNAYTVSKPGNKKAVSARFELGELTADN